MKTFISLLLFILIWTVLAAVCVGTSVLISQDPTPGVRVFLALFLIWYGCRLTVYLYRRWQAQKQVEQLVNVESSSSSVNPFTWIFSRSHAHQHLKQMSRLIKTENFAATSPDSIPWLLHLNLSNSGKWLNDEEAGRPLIQHPSMRGNGLIDWHFLNHSIVLDLHSDLYPDALGNNRSLIELFEAMYRQRGPNAIQTLVITISAKQINTPEAVLESSNQARQLIEDIRRLFQVDVPVQVVVEGSEQMTAMSDWLKQKVQQQPDLLIGEKNRHNVPPSQLVESIFCKWRTLLHGFSLNHLVEAGFSANIASLPGQLSSLQIQLERFCQQLFRASQLQRPPKLAGLFFVFEQDNQPVFNKPLLETNLLVEVPDKNQPRFARVLPQQWAWLGTAALGWCVFFALYQTDSEILENELAQYQAGLLPDSDITGKVNNLERLKEFNQALRDVNLNYWLLVGESGEGLTRSEATLNSRLQNEVLAVIDQGFLARASSNLQSIDNNRLDLTVDYINILLRRINLLNAALFGAAEDELNSMPLPYDADFLQQFPESMLAQLNRLYIADIYVASQDESLGRKRLNLELTKYKKTLSTLLGNGTQSLDWLVLWVNQNDAATPVKLSDYWRTGSSPLQQDIEVSRAFTVSGKQIIDEFMRQLAQAIDDPEKIQEWQSRFYAQYERNYFAAWASFMSRFRQGQQTLNRRDEWLTLINNLTTGRSIYYKVLNDADINLAAVKDSAYAPDWYELLVYYQDMLALSGNKIQDNSKRNSLLTKMALKFIGKTGAVGKAIAKQGKAAMKTKKKLDKASKGGPSPDERQILLEQAAKELAKYNEAISQLVYNIDSPAFSYQNITALYATEGRPGDDTPLGVAKNSIKKLSGIIGKASNSTQPFWSLYTGPVDLMLGFMRNDTGCYIDKLWQEGYLADIDGIPDYKLTEFAYQDEGVLWQFYQSHLRQFIKPSPGARFQAVKLNNQAVPVKPKLIQYLADAKAKKTAHQFSQYQVKLSAQATGVNKGAHLFVTQTEVNLQCGEQFQTLSNFNYPSSTQFMWRNECGPTDVVFHIGNMKLVKAFPGPDGFLNFMRTFHNQEPVFGIESFPEQFYTLNQFQVSEIKPNIELIGAEGLIKMLSRKSPGIPKNVAACW